MPDKDYSKAVEIRPGIHWVGKREKGNLLHCNPYLITINRSGGKEPIHILTDPGSPGDFKVTASKLVPLIGDLKKLSICSINHQDPDVVLASQIISSRFAPNCLFLMTENTWRLVAHVGIKKDKVRFVEQFHGALKFKDGDRELQLIPTPFCHFTGAFAVYDVSNRTIFTGDLFGGVTLDEKTYGLSAIEDNWAGIRMFHELYMPCNSALKYAAHVIKELDPPVEVIAPQHGSIIEGPLVNDFIERVSKLKVGADLLSERVDQATWEGYAVAANEILHNAEDILGKEDAHKKLSDDPELMEMAHFEGANLVIDKAPKLFVEGLVIALTKGEAANTGNQVKVGAIMACETHSLPPLSIDLSSDEEEHFTEDDILT